jgi:hypothetical protein
MKSLICVCLLFIFIGGDAQDEHHTSTYNDSVLTLLLKKVPKSDKEKFKRVFSEMTDEQRSLFYSMNLPISSKKELIKNVDTNYRYIYDATILFNKLIPSDLEVDIEFNPPQKLLKLGGSIDIGCSRNGKSGDRTQLFQEWDLELSSPKLDSLLTQINMDRSKLEKLRISLIKANCISINNNHPAEVGFARSGMGKYYYLIFHNNLTPAQIKWYNKGCEYLFYRDNIVLMYGGGVAGSICFPYEDPE